jgi:hypothetical protein
MTTALLSLLDRRRPAVPGMRRTVRRRNGPSGPFFRGLLIGVALVSMIALLVG